MSLGVYIKDEKNIQAIIADFLGIKLDSIKMKARLPSKKLQKARE